MTYKSPSPFLQGDIKVAFFDMDSTIIANECIDELAALCGVGEEVAAITKGAMEQGWDFETSLRKRIDILIKAGLPEDSLERCYAERIRLTPGAEELLAHLKQNGVHCVLVSGGFTFFTSRIVERLGFDEHYGNLLVFNNGQLSGVDGCPDLDGRIISKEAKRDILLSICSRLQTSPEKAMFVGDGSNDALAVKAAGYGIAYHASSKELRAAATLCIDDGDLAQLTALCCDKKTMLR